jgi:glucose-1-phosphate thymidylyltransferase
MKGIILAGGTGTRLAPMTSAISKQMLPVYNKPMLYYPLSVLMLAGIRDILIISTPRDLPTMQALLGDGGNLGLQLSYREQEKPEGVAQAFIIAESFIENVPVCLILGDNIFYGQTLVPLITDASKLADGGLLFACRVHDPERYGVIEMDKNDQIISIEEKPAHPKSSLAMTGLYFYDSRVVEIAKSLKPSARGELEISDICKSYLASGNLKAKILGRGTAWFDAGTPDALLEAAQFVQTIESRQGTQIACLEEVALHKGFINTNQFEKLAKNYSASEYGQYLRNLL